MDLLYLQGSFYTEHECYCGNGLWGCCIQWIVMLLRLLYVCVYVCKPNVCVCVCVCACVCVCTHVHVCARM